MSAITIPTKNVGAAPSFASV